MKRSRSPSPASAPPADLCCPIMRELMRDPVCNSVGNSYGREALLQAWARQPGRERDPLTNELVPSTLLFPNQALRRQIVSWLEEHSAYTPEGCDSRQLAPLLPQPHQEVSDDDDEDADDDSDEDSSDEEESDEEQAPVPRALTPEEVLSFLNNDPAQTSLHLRIGISEAVIMQVAESLGTNTSVKELFMYPFIFLTISDAVATRLAESLAVNQALQKLYMFSDQLGDVVVTCLAAGLRRNTKLETLGLITSRVGDAGVAQLAESLRLNTGSALTTMTLVMNRVGDDGAIALANYVRSNTPLRGLRLYCDNIGDAGKTALRSAWSAVPTRALSNLVLSEPSLLH